MKKVLLLLMFVGGLVGQGLAVNRTNSVWASGNVAFGRAVLSMGSFEMPGVNHTLTIKSRLISPTGRTTGWIQKTTYMNQVNDLTIPMSLFEEYGSWTFEAAYVVLCPLGGFNSNITQSTFFTFGHSNNCLFIQSGTQQVITLNNVRYWYALYNPAVGCRANCVVSGPIGIKSPYVGTTAPAYVNFKYNWVHLNLINQTYCLEAYDKGTRIPCNYTSCNDTTGF